MDVESSDDEYEDYGSQADFVASRHAMVFCIDASEKMFEPAPSDEEPKKCYLQVCLARVKERLLHNIFVSDKEYISIFLMGADLKVPTSAGNTSNRTVEFFELSRPGAEICSTLDTLIKKTVKQFKSDFYNDHDVHPNGSLSDTLWTCSSQLSLAQTKFSVKDVVIMTCNDLSDLDANTRRQTLKRAEALAQVGIFLRLMYIGDESFIEPFYKDLLLLAHPGSSIMSGSHWAATDLVKDPNSILSKCYHNRHNALVDFVIGATTKITVKVYSFFRRLDHVSRRQEVKLFKQTNEQLTVTSSRFDSTTGELLHRDNLVYGIKLDNKAAYFKQAERSKAKEMYPVNITLLGFKPVSEVFWGDHIQPGMMIVPDDVERPGSSSLFYALHKVCLEDNKSPLVRLCLRKGSRARLAHMLPMLENMTGNVPINYFLIKYMPFQGECRDTDVALEIVDKDDITEVIEDAKNIIKKSTCKFLQASFPNPKLNMFYSAVEALALNLDQPREVIDNLEPEVEEIDLRVGKLVKAFNANCESAAATLN